MRYRSEMNLENINVRTEKHGDKDVTAIDLKLHNPSIHISKLKGLFPTEASFQAIVEHFYDTETGELITGDLGQIKLSTEGIGVKATVKSQFGKELEFDDEAKINDFKITLEAGRRADLSCRLQVLPTSKQISELAEMLKQGVTVSASWKRTAAEELAEKLEEQAQLDLEREEAAGEAATVQ